MCISVEMCIRGGLLALIEGGLRSLDARASDSRLAWTVRSADRIPCWAVGNFSLLMGMWGYHRDWNCKRYKGGCKKWPSKG